VRKKTFENTSQLQRFQICWRTTGTVKEFAGDSGKIVGYFPQRIFVRKHGKKPKKVLPREEPQPTWVEWQSSAFDQLVEETATILGENKKGVGRPTVGRKELWARRDDIATLLESHWVHIGWKLQCLRNPAKESQSPELVRIAFEPVRGKHGSERIPFLLRPTSLLAKSGEVRAAKKALDAAHEKLQTVRRSHDALVTKFKERWRAYYETSERYREQLKKEITVHITKRLRLKNGIAGKEQLARNLRGQENFKSELLDLEKELENCRGWLLQENATVDDLARRYALATKNRALVRGKVKDCIEGLRSAKNDLKQQTAEAHRLEELYSDQAAGFARQDFLEFSVQQRGKHHPRHVANALAGLPEMACRQSYPKCQQIPFQGDPHPDFQTFELIERAWTKRSSMDAMEVGNLLMIEVRKLSKTRTHSDKRAPNHFREHLLAKERALREAIVESLALKPCPHPDEFPYVITRIFLEKMSPKPTSALERVLSQT